VVSLADYRPAILERQRLPRDERPRRWLYCSRRVRPPDRHRGGAHRRCGEDVMEAARAAHQQPLRTFRRCPRLHYYLYVLLLRALLGADELRFGDLVHRGLRRWWEALLPPGARELVVASITDRATRSSGTSTITSCTRSRRSTVARRSRPRSPR
jgi:hypothetical protein